MSYRKFANDYTEKGLQVIPLYPFSRVPSIKGAAQFKDDPIPKATVENWQEFHPSFNIGCVTGESSGVCFLRVATKESKIMAMVTDIIGVAPWKMVDGDYTVLAFEHNPDIKPFEIYPLGGSEPLIEFICDGKVQILPPSIPSLRGAELAANSEFFSSPLSALPEQFEDIFTGAIVSLGLKLAAKAPEPDEVPNPLGTRQYKMRELALRLTQETLSGRRTMQECFDIFGSVGNMLECEDSEVMVAHDHYFQWLRSDMELFGRSLPKTWDNELKSEIEHGFDENDTEWDYNSIKEFVYSAISSNFHEQDAKLVAVQETLRRMNQAQTLDVVQEDQLLRYIVKQANLGFSIGVLRRQLKTLHTGTCPGENQAEIARAFLDYATRTAPLVFCDESIYRFTGAFWEKVPDRELAQNVAELFGHLPAAKRASDHYGVLRILKGWLPETLKHPKYETMDGINFANGFLDSDLVLHPHHSDFGATYMMPFEYDADKADGNHRPMFNQFLKDCWGFDEDFEDKQKALREAIAITLLGNAYKYQKVFLLFGAPKSGKSQLLNIVSSLVPISAKTSLPPTEWGERFRPAQLYNKILNIAGELSEHRLIEGQIFKDIVDGTEQLAENKGTNFFRFVPKCAHWFASNHFPKTKDTSEGFNRRWQIFTFKHPLADGAAIIRDLGHIIAARERQSIVAWALQSLPALQQRGEYTTPMSHLEALTDVAGTNNSVRFFMTGSGLVEVSDRTLKNRIQHLPAEQLKSLDYLTGDVLHTAYLSFALGVGGVRPVSSQRFHQMMQELCPMLGLVQKRIQRQNGITTFAYFNLKVAQTGAGIPLSMESLIGTGQTDLPDGFLNGEKYQ